MENNKALTADQLDKLKETVRQHFDELYHRIGSNRQNLFNKVLFVDQQINKELTREMIDDAHEKEILRKVREIERSADNQLPLVRKVVPPLTVTPKVEKPVKESKPKEQKVKDSKPKEQKVKDSKPKESKTKASKSKPARDSKAKAAKKKKKK